jgi:hypothetical protein
MGERAEKETEEKRQNSEVVFAEEGFHGVCG